MREVHPKEKQKNRYIRRRYWRQCKKKARTEWQKDDCCKNDN